MGTSAQEVVRLSDVVPVVTVEEVASVVPLARALLAGGVAIMEVTLRTPAALDAITALRSEVPEMTVGAGTVLSPTDAERARRAGAEFLVAPGLTPDLAAVLRDVPEPALPGAATVSEMMRALDWGFRTLKFFPAMAAGGPAFLRSVAAPLPQLEFCPTGGVSEANAADWLSLPNVVCVGGTWVTPPGLVRAAAWDQITVLARDSSLLRST